MENLPEPGAKPRARVNVPKIYRVSGKFPINFFQIFLEDFFSSFVSKNITKKTTFHSDFEKQIFSKKFSFFAFFSIMKRNQMKKHYNYERICFLHEK